MLTSVMPGVRELRAPLTAGFLWLLWAWLVFGGALPSSAEPGHLARLYELGPVVSDFGRAVVASVAAYIIGSIVIDAQVRLGRPFASGIAEASNRRDARERAPKLLWTDPNASAELVLNDERTGATGMIPVGIPMTPAGAGVLANFVSAAAPEHFEEAAWRAQRWIALNRAVLKTRLLDLSPALHSEVDRPDAEATFRMALWPPLAALVLYLVITAGVWWLGALVIPVSVAWQWKSLRQQANDALITAISVREELQALVVEAQVANASSASDAA